MEDQLILEILIKCGVKPKRVVHNERKMVSLTFEYDEWIIGRVKQVKGYRWSKALNVWLIPDDRKLLDQFALSLTKPKEEVSHIPDWINDFMRQLVIRGYSNSTRRNYRNVILMFYRHFHEKEIRKLTKEEIELWLEYLASKKEFSSSSLNQAVNAVKFLYEKVWGNDRLLFRLPRAKKDQRLPKVLHQSEIERIFSAVTNLKHKILLYTAYAAGLRVSELVNLKLTDIRSKRMEIFIEKSKGKKDRIVMLPEKLLELLRVYAKEYKPKYWLFEGQNGESYSVRSVQVIFSRAKRKAGIRINGGPHLLRHSFATHLLESGIDITIIKELLGHNSIRTTMTYTHVSNRTIKNVVSPLDKLNLK